MTGWFWENTTWFWQTNWLIFEIWLLDVYKRQINSHEPFLSTLIGRYGNRIAGGKFILEGKEYSLTINNGPHSLHGGPTGFHTRIWDAEQETPQSLKLHYLSADGEEGFPGNRCV